MWSSQHKGRKFSTNSQTTSYLFLKKNFTGKTQGLCAFCKSSQRHARVDEKRQEDMSFSLPATFLLKVILCPLASLRDILNTHIFCVFL